MKSILLETMVSFAPNRKGGDMPNLMRLRPVKGGKKWYTNFRNSKNYKEKIEVALDAFEHEKHKAAINLGKILQDLDYGVNPISVNKTIGQLPKLPMDKRNDSAYRTHILPKKRENISQGYQ